MRFILRGASKSISEASKYISEASKHITAVSLVDWEGSEND
ncbi:hypothetical protein AB4278_16410 [Vibrio splendidus]